MASMNDASSRKKPRVGDDEKGMKCPFLDTVNRQVLDFDFEKVCSISLSEQNVYCCLVCGKYFQGRGKQTYAYTHSTMSGHHMFLNLSTCRVYCLPENYEVVDSSLEDVVRCLKPEYSDAGLDELETSTALARDVHGVAYLPGFCGLNNLKHTDYVSVVVHALGHVKPLRNYFLQPSNYATCTDPLVVAFGELLRKLWSKENFKSVVSPHELTQIIVAKSKRRFEIGRQSDAGEFMAWFLHALHSALTKTSKTSIIHDVFRGEIIVETLSRRTASVAAAEDQPPSDAAFLAAPEDYGWRKDVMTVPFLYLTLDIPPTPLFKDSFGGDVIPQIPLFDVLAKYNGLKLTDSVKAGVQSRRRYRIKKLPPFLMFHLARFSKNNFASEKNPTIVNFPAKNLELKDQFAFDDEEPSFPTKFNLLANVCHDLPAGIAKENHVEDPLHFGTYRVHVQHPASEQWYEIQDLHVTETMPQLIGLSESLMMIYKATS